MAEAVESKPAQPSRVIIDTDPGVDDSMALFLTLQSPELHVEGLTIVQGNHHDIDMLAHNACLVLHMAREAGAVGLKDGRNVPVIKGAAAPMATDYHGHSGIEVHGDNGLGFVAHPVECSRDCLEHKHVSAAAYIVQTCLENPGEITLVALGPLTNLALAVKMGGKRFVDSVKSVCIMGGTVGPTGNKTPCAEANAHNDPHAARVVFESFPDITMAGLNVTQQLVLTPAFREDLKSLGPGTIGEFCYEISEHYVNKLRQWENDAFIHDSTAIMALIRPDLFESKRVHISVSTEGITAGVTVADWKRQWGHKPQTTVLTSVDVPGFLAAYLERIRRYAPYCDPELKCVHSKRQKT